MKARTLTSAILAAIGATALLAGTALAMATPAPDTDGGNPTPPGTAISTLARTTAEVGEAKGDAISAAATALDPGSAQSASSANSAPDTAPGAAISQLATTTTATGEAKGLAISTAARAIHPSR